MYALLPTDGPILTLLIAAYEQETLDKNLDHNVLDLSCTERESETENYQEGEDQQPIAERPETFLQKVYPNMTLYTGAHRASSNRSLTASVGGPVAYNSRPAVMEKKNRKEKAVESVAISSCR